jgi:uncharacterized protein
MDADIYPRLIAGLLQPQAYPRRAGATAAPVDHIETHISHVFLSGDHAYKLKKAIDLGFLDYSTLARRHFCCEEEVRLNRRLSPDLYRGVVAITGSPEQPRMGGDGPVLEYAVDMGRFAQDTLLTRVTLTPDLIDRIATRVAAFHEQIPRADPLGPFGTPAAVLAPMLENLRQVRARVRDPGVADRLDRLRTWTLERWRTLTPAIAHRLGTGRVRECHGDLHRANIALAHGEPLFFDGIEFNPGLRWIDTASELAFLIMDLEEAGTPGLAGRLLNQYLEHTGDFGALEVLDLYKVYRAMVRAKVLAIRLDQADLTAAERATQRCDCARYLALAASYTHTRRPRLLIACGLSGSGKSTLARGLGESLPMIHLRSDVERKRLFGLPGETRSDTGRGAGIYFPQATAWTYLRLQHLAGAILACGYDVVVDATFLTRARRATFQDLAHRCGGAFAIIALMAPLGLLRTRVAQRLAAGGDASEASVAVLEHQRAVWERLSLAERRSTIIINSTDLPPLPGIVRQIAELTS